MDTFGDQVKALANLFTNVYSAATGSLKVVFTSNKLTRYKNTALTNTPQLVKAGTTKLQKYNFSNPNAAVVFVHLYNAATAGEVTVGTTTPTETYMVPSGAVLDGYWGNTTEFDVGMVIASTSTVGGSAAPATGLLVNLGVA